MTFKLLDWIDIIQIDWNGLSENPYALDLLKTYSNKINWNGFSRNKSNEAINILKANYDKIDWDTTSNTKLDISPVNLYRNISLFLCIFLIHSFLL